jgi:Ni/Co efflux regulator RcnB
MKKLLVVVCGAAMISIATLSQAQDSTSTEHNNQSTVEQKSHDQSVQDQPKATQDQQTQSQSIQEPVQDGTNAIRQGQSRESGPPTEDQIDQTMERPNEMVPVEGKVGPNGEAIFRENGKYFYMNEAGEKKKIKESQIRDKTQ